MKERLQNFVFRGMLLGTSFEGLEEGGIIVSPPLSANGVTSEKKSDGITLDDFSSRIRLNAMQMSSVYTAFFCFENSVRDLITERLKERVGASWWDSCVSQKIKKTIETRKTQDGKNRWHAPRSADNIAYTDFGDMADIICNNWPHFEDLFPSQDWVRTRIGDLEQSRNAIAHSNVLSERDIERIKMHLGDWLKQVG